MNKKALIILIVALGAGFFVFLFLTAKVARKESDRVVQDFKSVDESLKKPNAEIEESMTALKSIEEKILDTIASLPETKERASYIESQTKGKRNLAYQIFSSPHSMNANYWVKAVEDNGDSYVTHFNFYVNPISFEIKYLDIVNDTAITLEEWRRQNKK
jgi:ribosomal protein S6